MHLSVKCDTLSKVENDPKSVVCSLHLTLLGLLHEDMVIFSDETYKKILRCLMMQLVDAFPYKYLAFDGFDRNNISNTRLY